MDLAVSAKQSGVVPPHYFHTPYEHSCNVLSADLMLANTSYSITIPDHGISDVADGNINTRLMLLHCRFRNLKRKRQKIADEGKDAASRMQLIVLVHSQDR